MHRIAGKLCGAFAVSTDLATVVVSSSPYRNGTRYKYSEEANTQVLELKHHQDAVRAVLFNPDGQSTFWTHELDIGGYSNAWH